MFEVDLGKIKFKWKGEWSSSANYTADDVVRFGDSAYVALAPSTNANPTTTPVWELMISGMTGMLTQQGDMLIHDGNGTNRLPKGGERSSLVMRGNDPVWKPQGVIQTRVHQTNELMSVNGSAVIAANTWYPINTKYNPTVAAWQPYNFEVAITPQFENSLIKLELSLHAGWREGSYHQFGRIMMWNGTSWVRHPLRQRSQWHQSFVAQEADHGAYTFTTNGATYVYQGEQVQLTQYYPVDGVNIVAGQEVKFRWEFLSTASGFSLWLNAHAGYYNQNYARSGNSMIAATEINNGD